MEGVKTFGDLIELHLRDMKEVRKTIGRSKSFSLELLKDRLGTVRLPDLDRERLIEFDKERADEGAGPVTLGIDLGYVRTLLAHGAAVHGLPFSPEPVELARIALKRLGLIGKGTERDRRPTEDEIDDLLRFFRGSNQEIIPVDRIIRFAIATAMRQDEICRVEWSDVSAQEDSADPRPKGSTAEGR